MLRSTSYIIIILIYNLLVYHLRITLYACFYIAINTITRYSREGFSSLLFIEM